MIRLRGHHLVCLNFYRGEGYNREFVANLEDVMRRARSGEAILVVSGADDICSACPALRGDECVSAPGADAEIRKMDARALDFLGIKTGSSVCWEEVARLVLKAPAAWLSSFCEGCAWWEACYPKKKALGLVPE